MAHGPATEVCHFCGLIAETDKDAVMYVDTSWLALCVGNVPGWVAFGTRRHADDWLWGLTEAEQASFGPLVTQLSRAVREVTWAAHVYILGLGEISPHFHSMLVPRVDDDMSIERAVHGVLDAYFGACGDRDAALDYAARVRDLL